ncbi:hypothetical protein EOD41_10080 [Mucilaginibacter limnophilus]|uniref:Uncharacterized protein n=1 Tax=Mucilaginibacter limnophilus TaxID=1932778 RepID=A0A437MTQ6_9SPHI|nr:hypothetical protein [Mucilaginibacter limnophilus]RVU00970.1 hypothetical protein EOD41_10080 [Mucilaginibacter limnophilus]
MSILLIRILLFCCIPVGIFILVKGIKLIRRSFYGTVFLEIAYSEGGGRFTLIEAGSFSIWLKAPLLKRVALDKYKPQIYNVATGEELHLSYSITGMHANGFYEGRQEIFTFSAEPGEYQLQLIKGSSLSGLQSIITRLMPSGDNIDLSKHFLQVRETQPAILAFLAIPIIILGVGGIIGGFVLGLLADQVFK